MALARAPLPNFIELDCLDTSNRITINLAAIAAYEAGDYRGTSCIIVRLIGDESWAVSLKSWEANAHLVSPVLKLENQ